MDLFGRHEAGLPFALPPGGEFHIAWVKDIAGYRVLVPHGELLFVERFFDRQAADRVVAFLQENDHFGEASRPWKNLTFDEFAAIPFANIRWRQEFIRIYGKVHPLPRLTSWYGDADATYTYSGVVSRPNPWNDTLRDMRQRVGVVAESDFNSVLLNWYRDGSDKLDWHADDEPELGRNPTIASLSFGASRDFVLRLNSDHATKISIPLGHGALLVMRGALQGYWQHSVPKRARVSGSRFNLTFRRIAPMR